MFSPRKRVRIDNPSQKNEVVDIHAQLNDVHVRLIGLSNAKQLLQNQISFIHNAGFLSESPDDVIKGLEYASEALDKAQKTLKQEHSRLKATLIRAMNTSAKKYKIDSTYPDVPSTITGVTGDNLKALLDLLKITSIYFRKHEEIPNTFTGIYEENSSNLLINFSEQQTLAFIDFAQLLNELDIPLEYSSKDSSTILSLNKDDCCKIASHIRAKLCGFNSQDEMKQNLVARNTK